MSKKTEMEAYKEGLIKEAQISSEKHEAQEKNFNEERIAVKKGMEGIRAVVDQLVDDGEIEVLRRIYKLEKDVNLQSIESSTKEIIVAILYECCKRMEVVEELQTSYLLTLQRYLDVTEPQRNYDFEALNSNDELTTLDNKAIFKVLVEFMYLKNNNSSYESDMLFQEVCGSINITDANKKHITNEVVSLGEIAPEAIIAQYGYLTEELLQDNTDVPENNAKEPTNNINSQEIEDAFISVILQIPADETKVFSYKNIHISSYINCEGRLEFDNCVIYYNESSSVDEITLAKCGSISFKSCTIICLDYDKTEFITGAGSNKISFENCVFENCSQFLTASVSEFQMMNCQIVNCYGGFININLESSATSNISDCFITEDNIAEFNLKNDDYNPKLFSIRDSSNSLCEITNITVVENDGFRSNKLGDSFHYFSASYSDIIKISNCTFVGAKNCINDVNYIKNCQFKDCQDVIKTAAFTNPLVDNCYFEHCTNILHLADNSTVSHCQFNNCYNTIIDPDHNSFSGGILIEFCEFTNLHFLSKSSSLFQGNGDRYGACIKFRVCSGKDRRPNTIHKCIFNGVKMNTGFLIQAIGFEKPGCTVAYIKNCDFSNCTTQRESGAIIKTLFHYDTLLKKNIEFPAIKIADCKGLEDINKKNKNQQEPIKVKTKDDIGSAVAIAAGSLSATTLVHVSSIIGGPLGGAIGFAAATALKSAKNHTTVPDKE